jgi:anti-anti-sigma factor
MANVLHHKVTMTAANAHERVLTAPECLGLETRAEFRRQGVGLLEQLPEGDGRLVVDLGSTGRVDSAGLGALMLVQRRAEERHQRIVLRNASDEVRYLLALTKLLDLFELEAISR